MGDSDKFSDSIDLFKKEKTESPGQFPHEKFEANMGLSKEPDKVINRDIKEIMEQKEQQQKKEQYTNQQQQQKPQYQQQKPQYQQQQPQYQQQKPQYQQQKPQYQQQQQPQKEQSTNQQNSSGQLNKQTNSDSLIFKLKSCINNKELLNITILFIILSTTFFKDILKQYMPSSFTGSEINIIGILISSIIFAISTVLLKILF